MAVYEYNLLSASIVRESKPFYMGENRKRFKDCLQNIRHIPYIDGNSCNGKDISVYKDGKGFKFATLNLHDKWGDFNCKAAYPTYS